MTSQYRRSLSQDSPSQGVPEVPAMASLYLQPLGPMGLVDPGKAATGFIVTNQDGALFLVTNRHVVTGRNSRASDRLQGNSPSALRVYLHSRQAGQWVGVVVDLGDEDGQPLWWEHPKHGKLMDVVVLPFPAGDVPTDLVDFSAAYTVHGPALPRLGLASELYVIGYPIGFDPQRASAWCGVWTRGTVAWPPSLDWEGLPITLLDCRARGGQSGSPVVFCADELTSFRACDDTERTGPAWDFIGVYSGRTHPDSDIGMIWKRSAIDEIITGSQRPAQPGVTPLDPTADRTATMHPQSQSQGTALD